MGQTQITFFIVSRPRRVKGILLNPDILERASKLVVMPESLYQDVASAHFSEYTLLRAWMKQWLNGVQWSYTNLALPFERFLSAPVVQHHWKVRTEDPL